MSSSVPLSTVATVIPGTSPAGAHINDTGVGLPFFQGAKEFGFRHPTPERFTDKPVKTAERGDILLSVRAPVGRVNIAAEPCAIGRGVMAVRARDPQDRDFLAYTLSAMGSAWEAHSSDGTMFANLSKPGLEKVDIRWPEDRHAVGEALATVDNAIESTHEVERLLLHLGITTLEKELEQQATRTLRVDEAAAFHNRRRIPLSQLERDKRPGPYPYHGATGVFGCVDDYLFDGLYILVGEDGSVIEDDGTPVLQLADGKFWVNNHAHVLQGKALPTSALWFALRSLPVDPAVTGAVQPKLSMGRFAALDFLYPVDGSGFERVAEECVTQLLGQRRKRRALLELRDFVLPRLVAGDLAIDSALLTETSA